MILLIRITKLPIVLALFFLCIFSESNTIRTSVNNQHHDMSLNRCGHLCTYVDYCRYPDYYEGSEFMQSLCNFMIQDISYLNDETKVLQIAPKYLNQFHKYELYKQMARKKRSSKRKVVVVLKVYGNNTTKRMYHIQHYKNYKK